MDEGLGCGARKVNHKRRGKFCLLCGSGASLCSQESSDLCLATPGGGGSFWGCLRTRQPTHPPTQADPPPPTHPS